MVANALSKLRKRLGFSGPIEEKSGKTRASSLPGELCRHFSLEEIKTATHDFNKELIVGAGGFGLVYKGFIDEGNSRPVMIKRLNPSSKQALRTETLLLCQIHHVHIIPFLGYCTDKGEMILVYDFMANSTLRDHLYDTDKAPLPWKQRLQICIGVARGLHCLHTGLKHPVIHCDVKPTNILLDEKWVAKVSDFGLSKQVLNDIEFSNFFVEMEGTRGPLDFGLSEASDQIPDNITDGTMVRSTMGYMDPEILICQRLSEKSDVFSFGVVLLEVLCARKPMNSKLQQEQWNLAHWARKCNENGSIGKIIDPCLKGKIAPECFKVYVEIAITCVQDQGIHRPTIADVMEKLELALGLQEKADAEREKMISPDSEACRTGFTTYSDIMEDVSTNSQTPPN